MESKNFLKWFFGPNSSSSSSSASPSATMSAPDDQSAQSAPGSGNAAPDPAPPAVDQLAGEVRQLDLKKQPESADQVAGGGVSDPKEEEGSKSGGGGGEEKRDCGADVEVVKEEVRRNEDGGESEKEGDGKDEEEAEEEEERRDAAGRKNKFPVRPEAEDCAFYLKNGTCKFGSHCKFNHPIRRRPQVAKERVKDREESKDKTGQVECKYYLTPGGCKYGKACRYSHSRANTITPVELNFLGLPIRPGEKECPFYMRTGTCKFAANCKFNHPDPTSGADPTMEYSNGASAPPQHASNFPVWPPSGTLNNECPPYVPMMYSPTQVVSSPNAEWNGYQFPLNPQPQGQNMHPPPAYVMNSPTTTDAHMYTNHQQHMGVEDFPERPGQPECSYFLKTGDCKFKSNCKYHHPKDRVPKSPQVALSDKGLPLRPDQNICSYYSRYGICKFGPACKFDHSVQLAPSELENQPSMENSVGEDDPTMGGSGTAGDPTAVEQQPV